MNFTVTDDPSLNLLIHSWLQHWGSLILLFSLHVLARIFLYEVTFPHHLFEYPKGTAYIGMGELMLFFFFPLSVFFFGLVSWFSTIIQRGQVRCYVCFLFFVLFSLLKSLLIYRFQYFIYIKQLQLLFLLSEIVTFQAYWSLLKLAPEFFRHNPRCP